MSERVDASEAPVVAPPEPKTTLWEMIDVNGSRMLDRQAYSAELQERRCAHEPVTKQARVHGAIQDLLLFVEKHEESFKRWFAAEARGGRHGR